MVLIMIIGLRRVHDFMELDVRRMCDFICNTPWVAFWVRLGCALVLDMAYGNTPRSVGVVFVDDWDKMSE